MRKEQNIYIEGNLEDIITEILAETFKQSCNMRLE